MSVPPILLRDTFSNYETLERLKASPPPSSDFIHRGFSSKIHEAFQQERVVILSQEEGVYCKTGKTAIAKNYLDQHARDFTKVFWVQSDCLENIPKLLEELDKNQNWLLVLDGFENPRQLRDAGFVLETLQQKGQILITTRENNWSIPSVVFPVGLCSIEETVRYFLNQFPCKSETAEQVAQALGGVPTSICKAVQETIRCGVSLEHYLLRYQTRLERNGRGLEEKSNLSIRNQQFVGREANLVALEETMARGEPLVLAAEIGLGGIGKTQLALQYAHRTAPQYSLIWWINAEDRSTLLSSYQALAKHLQIPVGSVNQYLQEHPGWLLIFDDAPNPAALQNFIPKSGGHILITSRCTAWGGVAQVFKVGVFKPNESVELIMNITKLYREKEDAAELSELLHHLPLAIAQAAAYIKETKVTIQKYIEKFQQKHRVLWKYEIPPDIYQHTVNVTWNLTMERILEEEQQFLQQWRIPKTTVLPLMQSCSLFNPKDIPREILLQRWANCHLGEAQGLFMLTEALRLLGRYSMIDLTKSTLSIHALVQTVIRDALSEDELRSHITSMNQLFQKYQGDDKLPLFHYWDKKPATINNLYFLLPHALSLATHAESVGLKGEAVELLLTIGAFSYHQGNLHLAETVLERALKLDQGAGIYKNLGNVYLNLGKLDEAEECYRKANDTSGILLILMKKGKLDEAEIGLRELLDKLNRGPKVYGTTDFRYFRGFYQMHLGQVLLKKEQPNEALKYLVNAESDFRAINVGFFGEVNYLIAKAYEQLSDPQNQRKHLQFTVEEHEKTANPNNPNSIQDQLIMSLQTLADLAIRRRDYESARRALQRAITLSKIKFGPDSKNTTALYEQLRPFCNRN